MKTLKLFFTILLLLKFTTPSHFRVIIIENGYNWKESSRFRVRYDQDENTKIFTAILLTTDSYKKPQINADLANGWKVSTIIDENKWELVSFNDQFVNFGITTFGNEKGLELPIKKIDMKVDLNLGNGLRNFQIKKREFCSNSNKDKSSLFFYAYYFAKKHIYANNGFNLFMKKSEFSFSKNVYYMEDFESDIDPDNFRVSFGVESDYLSFFNVNLKFTLKILKLRRKIPIPFKGIENFKLKPVYYKVEEFEQNKNNFLSFKIGREDSTFDNFYLYFKMNEEPTKPKLSAGFGLVHTEDHSSNVVVRFYCEIIVDGFKRFFKTDIIQKFEHKNNFQEYFANKCFNEERNSNIFGDNGIWKRKYSKMDLEFDFWNNTKMSILGSLASFQSTTVRLSFILTSERESVENNEIIEKKNEIMLI